MQADPASSNQQALSQWASRLVCPACLGELGFELSRMICAKCARAYPVVDGIPVLIMEPAPMPDAAS